jgi:RNA polymerase sigma-70 factor (family 1)
VTKLKLYTDLELSDLLKSGDHAAYNEIYNRYERLLYIHAYKRLRDREEARDIIQDLFTVLWTKRSEIQFTGSLRAYLFTAVRNRIFDLAARQQLQSEYIISLQHYIDQGHYTTDHQARHNQLLAIIDHEIAQLPPKMRAVFELSRNEQLSHREIAEQLDISEQTVKKQVQNALKVLRLKLGPLFTILFFL